MTLFRTMVTDSFIALFAVLALLQHILPVHPFVARNASISTSSANVLRRHRQTLRPLRAEKSDDDDDDLSNNFLNFLKKNKEEEEEFRIGFSARFARDGSRIDFDDGKRQKRTE